MNFFLGFITGAALVLIPVVYRQRENARADKKKATSAHEESLNGRNDDGTTDRELLQELNRQFNQMMRYTGKEQRE